MSRNSLTPAAQDCLLVVYRISDRQELPTTSGLARVLGVTDSTVTAMVQKLARRKLLRYRARKEISLTARGRAVSQQLIRRHRLIETFLWTQLGYSLGELHEEAERLEHAVSDTFVERIAHILGHPAVDPHGDPIPTATGDGIERSLVPLTSLAAGNTRHVAQFMDTTPKTLSYLEGLGFYVGKPIEILEMPEADSFVRIRVGDQEAILGKLTASQILVI